jgi:hypothetical protein
VLTKPTPRQIQALRQLRSAELAPILEFLAGENGKVLGSLMTLQDENTLRQFQGRAQLLNEFLSLVQGLE